MIGTSKTDIFIDKQRNVYLDVVKGVSIWLVLWGHSIQYFSVGKLDFFEDGTFKFIYSFHMPLFMLVSGFLFFYSQKNKSLIQILKRKIIGIGIPIISWNTLLYVVQIIINYLQDDDLNLSLIGWLNSLKGLWFLWSILAISIVVAIICKISKGKGKLQIVLLILGIACMPLFPNRVMNMFMYPYFIAGFLFNAYKEIIPNKLLNFKNISLLIFPIMLNFYEKKHYIYTSGINPFSSEYGVVGQISIDIFRWGIGFTGSIFIICILEMILKNMKPNKKINIIINQAAKLGVVSLQIYVMQRICLEFVASKVYQIISKEIGFNLLAQNTFLYNFVFTPLIALTFAIVLFHITKLINKNNKLSYILFGR